MRKESKKEEKKETIFKICFFLFFFHFQDSSCISSPRCGLATFNSRGLRCVLSFSLCPMCVYKKELIMPPRQNGWRRDTWRWLRDRHHHRPKSSLAVYLTFSSSSFRFFYEDGGQSRWVSKYLLQISEYYLEKKKKEENASWVFGCL